jgi:hypothetical protein
MEGNMPWAEDATADATRRKKAAMTRHMLFFSQVLTGADALLCQDLKKKLLDHGPIHTAGLRHLNGSH